MTPTQHVAGQTSRLMIDHPGWFTTLDGQAQRAFRSQDTVWILTCDQTSATFTPAVEVLRQGVPDGDAQPSVDCFDPALLPSPFRDTPLIRDHGRLYRVRSTDLWESMTVQLVRRLTGPTQSIQRYRKLCTTIGGRTSTSLGTVLTVPRAETVTAAYGDAWSELASLPWIHPLRAAAEIYLERHATWARLPPDALYHALRDVPHISTLSAAAIIADLTNDFSRYTSTEFGTPGRWEQFAHALGGRFSIRDFEAAWKTLTPQQRSTLTALSIDAKYRKPGPVQALRFP